MTSETGPEVLREGSSNLSIWRAAPQWDGKRTAALGKIKFASMEDGAALLAQAAATLRAEGFEALIGPMDGDTWHAYRAVSESDGSAPFLMEPTSGPHDIAALTNAGFESISLYASARVATKDAIGAQPAAMPGVEIVNWDGGSPEALFGEVHDLSLEAFAGNPFYKPVDRDAFLALYMPYVPFLKPELIFFARRGDELAGFLFGIPDYTQGPDTRTAILKSYASRLRGVGHHLMDAFHRSALAHGYETCIHALMHEDNISGDRSRRHGTEVFRRYTLFGRTL